MDLLLQAYMFFFLLSSTDGLAVDWISDKLYWVDADTAKIEVSNLDGSNRTVLFANNIGILRAIVVDPTTRYGSGEKSCEILKEHGDINLCYSYTIALSGLFELYARGGCLNHEAKPSGLNARLERTIQ